MRDRNMIWLALAALALIGVGFFLPGWLLNQMVFAFGRGLAVLGEAAHRGGGVHPASHWIHRYFTSTTT